MMQYFLGGIIGLILGAFFALIYIGSSNLNQIKACQHYLNVPKCSLQVLPEK